MNLTRVGMWLLVSLAMGVVLGVGIAYGYRHPKNTETISVFDTYI